MYYTNTKLNHMKLLRLNCFFYLQKYQFGMFPNMDVFPGCEACDDISFSSSYCSILSKFFSEHVL